MVEDGQSEPIRKIDDATYGMPPDGSLRHNLLRAKRWFLLDADRTLVTALLVVGSFAVIVSVRTFGPVSVQSFLTEGVSPGNALVELMKAIVSVVVIVLSINQLVLSPGLGPVGDQRERFEQSVDLRREVEEYTEMESLPSSPAAVLIVILLAIREQAETLQAAVERSGDSELIDTSRQLTQDVVTEAETVSGLLSSSRFGRFDVVSASLRFAISGKVQTARALHQSTQDSLPEDVTEAFEELDDLLELFTVTREYLKTIYIREEYISLSEGLLYTGLPAIVLTYCAAQIYHPGVFPGQLLGFGRQLLFVAAAVAIALTPLAFLVSHVFRLAAMSRSTLFVGPFDTHGQREDTMERHRRGR